MMHEHTLGRVRLQSRAAGLAAFFAAVIPTGAAFAQPPIADFRAHVTGRVQYAMPEVNACASQVPGARLPSSIDVEVQVGSRGLSVRSLDRGTPSAWRGCLEEAIARAIAVPAGTQRTEAVRLTVNIGQATGAPVPMPMPMPVPVQQPMFTAGQTVQVEWNGQWYGARVLAIEPNGTFRIRYDGWSESWDEPVPSTRIRAVAGTTPRRPPPPRPPEPRPQPQPMPVSAVDIQTELEEQGRFRIRDVNLQGQGAVFRAPRGGTITGTATVEHNCPGCGGAINQVIVSLANDSRAQQCVWNGGATSGGPRQVQFTLQVPSQPGVYEIRARYAQAYGCEQGALDWWRTDRPNGPANSSTIGVVLVGGVEPQIRMVGGVRPPITQPQPQPQPSYGNLVVNGGFEQPGLSGGTWQSLPQLQGWFTTAGRAFEIQAGVAGSPFEGRQLIELDGDAPTTIGQDLSTRPGTTYEVSVAFSARPGTPRADNRVLVIWDGNAIGRLEADGTNLSDTAWTVGTFLVTARSGRSRLELRDEGTSNGVGSYIDDVRVIPTR